jgi:transposase
MTTLNPYKKKSHLWIAKTRKIIRMFAEDITATSTSKLLWIERKTINRRYEYMRKVIHHYAMKQDQEIRKWIIEVDESYFWPKRIRGKRWRWASNKIKVLWLLKREWKVFVQIVPDCSAKSLLPIIRGKVDTQDSVINTDWWHSYDGLIDLWYEKHYRVIHSENEFARGKKHVNGIESFWSYCKRRLSKFNGIKSDKFMLHLKETEFRFNCRLQKENIYKQLLKILKSFNFDV